MARHGATRLAATVALLAATSCTAGAAVRLCKPSETSSVVAGETEQRARKLALDGWKAKALAHGEPYASWRLAADKFLHCLPRAAGGYECIARAAPCTIEQAPERRELRSKRMGI
jgi:hypothetical protein